jgi:hypothetical protein
LIALRALQRPIHTHRAVAERRFFEVSADGCLNQEQFVHVFQKALCERAGARAHNTAQGNARDRQVRARARAARAIPEDRR